MNKLIVSFIIVTISFVLGCGVTLPPRASNLPAGHRCLKYIGEAYVACLEKEQLLKELLPEDERKKFDPSDQFQPPAARPEPPIPSAFPPNPAGALMAPAPVPVMLTYAPQGDGGCLPGNNLSIRNKGSYYLEVRGDNLRPCGSGNLTAITVSQPNGATRVAMVVPPGAKGLFYFYPHRDANGIPVQIASVQEYNVSFYRSGGLNGLQSATPSKKDYVCNWTHDSRRVITGGGVWGVVEVYGHTPINNLSSCRAV
jgi:hypothetical protein